MKLITVLCLLLSGHAIAAPSAEKITPAHVFPQQQAAALAIPAPNALTAVIVVTACNQVVGVVAVDNEGNIHPINIEGVGETKLKALLGTISQKLVVDTGCTAEPNRQPIF